ncbi:MAG: hypothetical protein JOZ60_02600 [Verrucomicrobia bacterium]|nr:hypothetical protein [Verrucomicrobiota bacterium]
MSSGIDWRPPRHLRERGRGEDLYLPSSGGSFPEIIQVFTIGGQISRTASPKILEQVFAQIVERGLAVCRGT